jgi:hypothetical protein
MNMRAILAVAFLLLCALPCSAQEAKAYLIITLVMPRDVPDIRQQFEEDSVEQCWAEAHEFVTHGVPKEVKDAVVVMAGCLVPKHEESDL